MNWKTEEEAMRLWCPMVRAVTVDEEDRRVSAAAFNMVIEVSADRGKMTPHGATTCIGAKCALWRWDTLGEDAVGCCGLRF